LPLALAPLATSRDARAFEDPVLGPAAPLTTRDASAISPGMTYRDAVERLRARLIGTVPDARNPVVLPLDSSDRARAATAVLPGPGVRVFAGVDLRWESTTDPVLGLPLANDALAFMLPGVVVTSRAGLALGPISLYAMAGAGTHRVRSYVPGERPSGGWSGVVLGGFGLGARLHRRVSLGFEATALHLTAHQDPGETLAPDPSTTPAIAAIALRIAY
jgi:hypothetical protein